MPGPVISPNGLFADFSVISTPLALTADDAHQVVCDPNAGAVVIQLNTTPSDGETYAISNTGGVGSTVALLGKAGAALVTLAVNQAIWLQFDSAVDQYLIWGKVALI